MNILREVETINETQMERFLTRVREKLWVLRNKRVAVWGLAFKQNTDDVRESVAIRLIKRLCEENAIVRAYDPQAAHTAAAELDGINCEIVSDMYECAQDADVLIVATEWKEFAMADLDKLRSVMQLNFIFDGRNILNGENVTHAGFEYHSIGRPSLYPTN